MIELAYQEKVKIISVDKIPSFNKKMIDELTRENQRFYGAIVFVDTKSNKKKGFFLSNNLNRNCLKRLNAFLENRIDELNINNPDYPLS